MPILDKFYKKLGRFIGGRFPKLYRFLYPRQSFLKFTISGTVTTISDLLFLFILHGLLNVGIVISTSISFVMSFAVSFYLQRIWTFDNREKKKMPRQFFLYMLNSFLSLNINGLSMHLLVNKIGIWYLLAQIIVNIALGILNFFIYKLIIFRKEDEINCEQKSID